VARIKADTGMPTIAVSLITESQEAKDILTSGKAGMRLSHGMLCDPR